MSPELKSVIDDLAKCETPDAVADLMRAAGVKGHPSDCWHCAISQYAMAKGIGFPAVSPSNHPDFVGTISDEGNEASGEDLPDVANGFALLFDAGHYPDLIA